MVAKEPVVLVSEEPAGLPRVSWSPKSVLVSQEQAVY